MNRAIILADRYYGTLDGKTAHGLVRYSRRYEIVGVIDSKLAGFDAHEVLGEAPKGIMIYASLDDAVRATDPDTLIVGVATNGGSLPPEYRPIVKRAIEKYCLNIVSGLHEFLSDDPEFSKLAETHHVRILDVRKLFKDRKDFFTGVIEKVDSFKVAVLGTDSAIGKRTTAILLTEALRKHGLKSVFIGTGQTSWMQGARYCVIIDAIVNDFVSGGIEAEIWKAYKEERPDVIVIEGQGSITHPAFPGGFEIIAAGRPDGIVLQHAPGRVHIDGFPNYPMPDLDRTIKIIELLSQKKVIGITINHENLTREQIENYVVMYEEKYKVPVCDPLVHGLDKIVNKIVGLIDNKTVVR